MRAKFFFYSMRTAMWKQAKMCRLFLLKKQLILPWTVPIFCPTFIASTSAALATVKWPRNEDSKNGFSFAVGRPEAEIIDILCFNIIWAFSFEATSAEKKGQKRLVRCVFLQVTRTKHCRINNKLLMLTLNWQSCLQRTCLHFTITCWKKIDATDRDEVQIETEETQRLKITR